MLNPADDLVNFLLRQQPAFDVFLYHTLLVDKHADRQTKHSILISDPILTVEQHWKRVLVLLNVFTHLGFIL